MDSIKAMAKEAKQRMKSSYWESQKKRVVQSVLWAEREGLNARSVATATKDQIRREVKGEVVDEFYLRVKTMLEEEGEPSDAIGRLTDKEKFKTLSYAEQQRYTLELSSRYVAAVEKYKKEKQSGL